jgi:hypothetical protein
MRIRLRHRSLLLGTLLCLTTIGTTRAQDAQPASEPEIKRFSFSVYYGGSIGGPAKDLEAHMRASGFDKNSPCFLFCTGLLTRPESYPGDGSAMMALKYRLRNRVAVQLLFAGTSTGMTIGDAGGGMFDGSLRLSHAVQTVAAIATLEALEDGHLQLGLGPALHTISTNGSNTQSQGATRLGLVFDAGLQFPSNSRFFVDLRAQYRWVGSVDIGPYTASGFNDPAVLPEASFSFNHTWLGVGFGVRL